MVDRDNIKRRSVLKLVGIPAIGLGPITKTGEPTGHNGVPIVTDIYNGSPIATETVPKEWYKRVRDVRKVQDDLVEQYSEKPWFTSVSRTVGNERIADLQAPMLEIGVTDKSHAPRDLPSQINNIPISVKERKFPEPECSTTCSCVKGGTKLDTEDTEGEFWWHSGCATVEHSEYGGMGYLTCAHGMGDCGDNIENQEVRACSGNNSYKIGTVDEFGWDLDWAFISEDASSPISGLTNEIISAAYPVSGHVTEYGIDYMISNSETAHKYGQQTCHTSGTIEAVSTFSYCDEPEDWIRTTADSDGGDSGCPHYRERNNYGVTTIIGLHRGSSSSYAYAGAAYRLNNKHEIEFTNNSSC